MHHEEFNSHRKSVRVGAGEIHYADVGAGPVALFVHGVFTSSHLWRNAIAGLSDERRCVAVDLPAHGRTEIDDDQPLDLAAQAELIEEFCVALSLEAVDLVANDTGGAAAQIYAARHPDRLRTLILTNCDVHDQVPPDLFRPVAEAARAGRLADAMQALAGDVELGRRSFEQCYERPADVPDATIREFLGPVADARRARQLERFVASMSAEDVMAAEPQLAELEAPTLIVWGAGDVYFDVKWAHWLRDLIAGAREVVELPDAKLFFPDERARDLVTHVREHWRAHAPARV